MPSGQKFPHAHADRFWSLLPWPATVFLRYRKMQVTQRLENLMQAVTNDEVATFLKAQAASSTPSLRAREGSRRANERPNCLSASEHRLCDVNASGFLGCPPNALCCDCPIKSCRSAVRQRVTGDVLPWLLLLPFPTAKSMGNRRGPARHEREQSNYLTANLDIDTFPATTGRFSPDRLITGIPFRCAYFTVYAVPPSPFVQ